MASSDHFASDARRVVSTGHTAFFDSIGESILTYSRAQMLSRMAGCAVALVALLVLIGWVIDIRLLTSGVPGWATMKGNTALALFLAGVSLVLASSPHSRWVRVVGATCAATAALVGLLTVGEYIVGRNLGIDELFLHDDFPAAGFPAGRMSPASALNVFLLGAAVGLLHMRGSYHLVQVLGIAAGAIGFVSVAGHLYGAAPLYTLGSFVSMAVHTAASFLILPAGILLAMPDRGPVGMLRSSDLDGLLARHLVPAALLFPILLGWLCLKGQREGLYNTEFGVALFVVAISLVLLVLVGWSNKSLTRMDRARQHGEQVLRQNYLLLNAVVEGTTEAIFIKDLTGRYVMVNAVTEGIMERPRAAILGNDDTAFFPSEIARALMETDQRIIQSGRAETFEETVIHQGKPRIMLSTKAPWRNEAGVVIGVIGVARDITDRKKLEEQFFQAQKMEAIGRLAGGIAHDFNNLLTAMIGAGQLLKERLTRESLPASEYTDVILSAADRAATLTRQLLTLSRRQIIEPKVLDLNRIVSEMEKILQRVIGENIELKTRCNPDAALVTADPGQVEQVIMNLVVNARDAMPHGGFIVIEVQNVELDAQFADARPEFRPGPYVLLSVSDTGHGMDDATKRHLFEPFFTTKERGKGTGLGLSTVFGIVKQSGGDISVYSEPGRGTTFKVYWPRTAERPEPLPPELTATSATGGPETILLVEDDTMVRKLIHHILEQLGYAVLVARSAEEALQVHHDCAHAIHLVLTDVILPRMSGPDLVERLLRLQPDLRVVYMSGYTDEALSNHAALQPRQSKLLVKPFTAEVLARKVREALS